MNLRVQVGKNLLNTTGTMTGLILTPTRHGRDESDSSQPKRARMDSFHEFIDPNKSPVDAGAK